MDEELEIRSVAKLATLHLLYVILLDKPFQPVSSFLADVTVCTVMDGPTCFPQQAMDACFPTEELHQIRLLLAVLGVVAAHSAKEALVFGGARSVIDPMPCTNAPPVETAQWTVSKARDELQGSIHVSAMLLICLGM